MRRRGSGPRVVIVGQTPRHRRIARALGETAADLIVDLGPIVALFAAAIGIAFGALWATGHFEPQTPAQRAGFPDPPPACEPGELPRRIYLSRGDVVMTCRLEGRP